MKIKEIMKINENLRKCKEINDSQRRHRTTGHRGGPVNSAVNHGGEPPIIYDLIEMYDGDQFR